MGRRPSNPNAIPRLRQRRRCGKVFYYYDHGGTPRREEPLGSDYGLAIKRWAEIEHDTTKTPSILTFRYVADRYRAEVVPTKAPQTQIDNTKELAKLISFFDDPPCPLDAIKPLHVNQYMRWRAAPVRATREKALLSHLWNWARSQGYTDLPNPCAGVKGARAGRKVYVEDTALRALWDAADEPLRDALDLAYLTGQRPADTLRMAQTDVRDGVLHIRQGKTGKALRIQVFGELAAVLERIAARKAGMPIHAMRLIVDENGHPLGRDALRYRFDKARAKAGVDFQFRDLRAKAATDKADREGSDKAREQLGHASVTMTEHYIRDRIGKRVTPTK